MVRQVAPGETRRPQSNETKGQESSELVTDFETALDLAGYGRFSLTALGGCAGAFFTTGIENAMTSYVLPAAKCDLNLTTYQIGLVNMAFMSGGVMSAFLWGIVADVFGRKRTITLTLLLDAFLTLGQSTVHDYRTLIFARTLNGFLIGGPSTLVLSYLSDVVGKKRRQLFVNLTGLSFTTAWIILPGSAWLILPLNSVVLLPNLPAIPSWRLYIVACSLPAFMFGLWMLFLPESPRLLLETNRESQAMDVVSSIFVSNSSLASCEFKVKQMIPDNVLERKAGKERRTVYLVRLVLKQLRLFVSKTYAFKSTLIAVIFFANMAAGFGLSLWIPELLVRMQNNEIITSCDEHLKTSTNASFVARQSELNVSLAMDYDIEDILSSVNEKNYSDLEWKINRSRRAAIVGETAKNSDPEENVRSNFSGVSRNAKSCVDEIGSEIYMSGLIVGACCVLGNAVCVFICTKSVKGVKGASCFCACFCAASCIAVCLFLCPCNGNEGLAVAAAAALNAAALNGNVLLLQLLLHSLPPGLSALGQCWGAWWGRAGGVASNLAVGALLDVSCNAAFIAVAAALFISVFAIILLKPYQPTSKAELSLPASALKAELGKNISGSVDKYITTHM